MTTPADRAEEAINALDYGTLGATTYRKFRSEIEQEFADELASEYPSAVPDEVFRMAWEERHSSGYHEVQSYYEELAGLASLAATRALMTLARENGD